MKKIVIFGLGNFGVNMAQTLVSNGCDVLGVDSSMDVINKYKDILSYAVIGDGSKKEVIESLQLEDYDAAVIGIGQDMSSGILTALYLKEIGIKRIVARAVSEDHGKILEQLGVSDVIFPEKDTAIKIANKLSLKNAVDYLPISDDYAIVEVKVPESFYGKTLIDLKIPSIYSCQVIGIKDLKENKSESVHDEVLETRIAPGGYDIVKENSVMIVLGKIIDIEKLQSVK